MIEQFDRSGDAAYDDLPEAIKHRITHQQWVWLSDHQKATLEQRETEPECLNFY